MYQSDRGGYRTNESFFGMIWNSCLGKTVILLLILGLIALIACITRPSEQHMREEMMDNIRQCIERNDSLQTDALDDAIANIGYIFTSADSVVNQELMANFKRYNRLEFYDHTFYSVMRVYNNFHIDGLRCCLGIFGVVIPTINFKDLLLRDGPIQTDEGGIRTIELDSAEPYFGETPDLIFREEDYY
jgi:hypothetical protein